MTLKRFQVRDLDVSVNEIPDMGLEGLPRMAILLGESIAIGSKVRSIPLLIENLGKRFKSVWKLIETTIDGQSMLRCQT